MIFMDFSHFYRSYGTRILTVYTSDGIRNNAE